MKKIILVAMAIPSFLSAQTNLFFEDFETVTNLTGAGWTMYNDTNIPFGTYQADFGTNAWITANWNGEGTNKSASTVSWFTVLNAADRWLITPAITIPSNIETATLSFKARSHDNMPFSDGFSLKISETTTAKSAFTTELLSVPNAPNQPISSLSPTNVDLSAYKGKTIYLSWINTFTNGNLLSIDDILVFATPQLATAEVKNSNNFNIYPNPAKESFQIQAINGSDKNLKITVSDASGKLVRSFDNQESYDISSLGKGIYFVTIKNGNSTETQKIIKK